MNIFTSKTLFTLLLLGLIGAALFVGKEMLFFFIPIILAYFIARIMGPLKNLLHKKLHLPVQLSTLLSMVVITSLLGTGLYFVGHIVVGQIRTLADDLPALGNAVYESIISAFDHIESLFNFTPVIFADLFKNLMDAIINGIGALSKSAGRTLLGFITFIPSLFFHFLIMLIATYYISNDLERFQAWWHRFARQSDLVNRVRETFQSDILFALAAYLKAQGILMVITFVIISIGLFLMGYKYFIIIALGIAVLDALPIFGTGTIFGPWVVIELLNANYQIAIFLGIIYIISSITRQVLQPKILSTQIGMNPFLTLVSIYAGIRLLGVLGIILGPMTMILIVSIVKTLKNTNIKIELR